ncbi:MAG: NAD-dependent epimerase/dehydratase family protein [Anaerolineae bacterium]
MLNLVTGATGLVGGHLVDTLLMRGEKVRVLVRPTSTRSLRELGVEVRVGNLMDNATLMSAAKGVDRIFHCAGLVRDWGQPQDFEQANVHGVRNILAAATRAGVKKFIHLSTSDVYGFLGSPVDETERPSPRGFPYSDSKIEGESLVWNHYRTVGLPVCILRPATVYGPRSQLLVVGLIDALRKGRLYLIDGGEHVAGLTYVSNLVDALLLAADCEASTGQAYNISDGSDVTWREYIAALADIAGAPLPTRNLSHGVAYALAYGWETYYGLIGRVERPPLTRMMVELMGTDQSFPIDKARRDLGYRPRVDLFQAMRYIASWCRRESALEGEAHN